MRQAKGRSHYDGDVNLPVFLTAKNLKPFIPTELYVTSSQIEFRRKNGGNAFGYPAELLPKICGVFVDADEAGKLTEPQRKIARQARLLLRGLAEAGIIALVDEATRYQEVRPKNELQKILAAYISPTLLPWTERFPMLVRISDDRKGFWKAYARAFPKVGDQLEFDVTTAE